MTIALSSIRNTEATLRWQGSQWVIAANISGITAVLYVVLQIPAPTELLLLAIGCVGAVAFNIQWYHVLQRDGRLLEFWNEKLREHEAANGIDGGSMIFTSPQYVRLSNSRQHLQDRLQKLCILFIVGWIILAIILPVPAILAKLGVS